jgi:probable phosphoglycerate mutase
LADRLATLPIGAIYSSPLERAQETAAPIGARLCLRVESAPGLNEVDFGEWTGRTLKALETVPGWRAFNEHRSSSRIPGGETMAEVLARAWEEMERIRRIQAGSGTMVAVVSHGDVLRALVAHSVGMPMDLIQRLELSPASVSMLALEDHGPRLLLLNSTAGLPQW